MVSWMRTLTSVLLLMALVLVVQPASAQQMLGKPAPEIEGVSSLDGRAKKLSDLKGKVVLIDFWAVWCGPCISTFPQLREWARDYQQHGLEILGVTTYWQNLGFDKDKGRIIQAPKALTVAEEHDMLKEFAAHHKLTHQLLVLTKEHWQKASKDYGIQGLPTAVLVDRQGNVRRVRVGSGPENIEALHKEIRKLLGER